MPFATVEEDAVANAKELLKFFVGADVLAAHDGKWSVDEAREASSVPSIDGTRVYTVFEVLGHVYKGRYRMRLAYDITGPAFILMGEEILEDA